jgi:hypothetical protein
MDFNHDTGTILTGLQTLDVTTTPPLGGVAGVLSIIGTGAVVLTAGTTAQRPAGVVGALRYNTDASDLEYYNGTAWVQQTGGTVTSIAATGSTGLTVGGSPITSSGTLTFTLASILSSLSSLATSGLTVNNAGVISAVTITGTAGNVVVTNGSGTAGAPTINLATAGTPVTGFFGQVTTDTFGRVTATAAATSANITTALGYTPVNKVGDTMGGILNMGGFVISNVGTPVAGTDAANKNYIDQAIAGLSWKQEVAVATTGNITLSGLQAIDGYTTIAGDRVLVKNQTTGSQNGIYIAAAGAWTRSTDADLATELVGAAVYITQGTSQADTGWTQTVDTITLGTTSLVWSQFSGSNTYVAGAGLTLTGNSFAITAPVSIALGGTGLTTTPANGALDIGNGTGFTRTTLTAGTGVSVTNAAGSITLANTGVTALTTNTGLSANVSATGAVTVTNTGALSVAGTANQVLVNGTSGAATTGVLTLTLPQAIATTSSPTFANITDSALTANGHVYAGVGGLLSSTAAGTNGQILISSTGGAPVLATITGTASQIGVTNAAGSITLTNLGVLSNVAGAGISVSGATGNVTIANTGVTSIVAGTGISISGATGAVTVNNTGVTSVALALPAIFTVSGSPVTTTGTLTAALATQTANTVFAAPNGSTGAPTFRALAYADLPIKLYVENPSTPTAPTAAGANAVAIGSGASASAANSVAVGAGSSATLAGSFATAGGSFATAGDAQEVDALLRNITTTATATELFLDGTAGTQRFVLPNNSAASFTILVTARRTDATGGAAGYKFEGNIRKDTTSASTALTGTPTKNVLGETNVGWDCSVSADTTNGSIKVTVTGEAAKTIRWVASVKAVIVTN